MFSQGDSTSDLPQPVQSRARRASPLPPPRPSLLNSSRNENEQQYNNNSTTIPITYSTDFIWTMENGGLRKRPVPTQDAPDYTQQAQNIYSGDKFDKAELQSSRRGSHLGRLDLTDIVLLGLLTAASLFTRLYKISWAKYVGKANSDEAHFGKFASHYLKREFYFDVHPPLGKMLLGLAGYLAGYDGTFDFESGKVYPDDLNYTGMRVFCAICGATIVPLAFLTALELKMSKQASFLLGVFVLVECSFATISRFILLDSLLLMLTATSVYCLVRFRNEQAARPFSRTWWGWLLLLGINIGAVLSVKWVGLFAIALVGLHTIEDLWEMLGDLKMPWRTYLKHWIARILCLIMIPVAVYMTCFLLHFAILTRSGPGDAQMSSLFQAGLIGNDFDENPLEIAFGSRISLKNNGHGGGLLHSHVQRYPTGSEQQQVTCYHHKDANNEWYVTKPWGVEIPGEKYDGEPEFLEDGAIIRLVHAQTTRNLHSHSAHKAPVTTSEYEVSCYGNSTLGDKNDHWKVEIVTDVLVPETKRVRSLTTQMRFRHVMTGCLLRSHNVILPQWGFKQAEVLCQKEGEDLSPFNIWNVEKHINSRLPQPRAGTPRPRSYFLHDFVHLNVAMWTSNNALVPDPDKEKDILTSTPREWPLMLNGLRMVGWADDAIKYYLVGNPTTWLGSTFGLVALVGLILTYIIRWRRQIRDFLPEEYKDFAFAVHTGLLGWFLHYMPFWIMGRVTYLHHYFPALYFALISFAFVIDHISIRLVPNWWSRTIIMSAIGALAIANFVYFAPLSFGFNVPAADMKGREWISAWNLLEP
ncbi:dolichyl-phosphate-mannose---protein mannosyltransferase [Synchytrium microbalum]|uniref:Dolichyl-phosphate-mannose--protein mannosyltransferase n=1 Tax=Synchytrium microbalum TaxID=1806994 RepID=A0A507C0X1_9FUNG|nr:dolichyl-phosphate-mannose---protein mannosyltransferase [Synchytrium microbalum]TPX33342.1 dolichyl-phosphate-mannose---protein mannosyltransferase [Synchytrium microbalum]